MFFNKKDKKMEDEYKRHISLLGFRATDKVTGFSGVIDSVCFDLYGCIQVCIKPKMNGDGTVPQGYWFDTTRLDIDITNRVCKMPDFSKGYVAEGKKGPADKPFCKA